MSDYHVESTDEKALTISSLTGASYIEALQILDANDNDMNKAVEMYFSIKSEIKTTSSTAPNQRRGKSDDDNVRAPDTVKRQKLIDHGPFMPLPNIAPNNVFIESTFNPTSDREERLAKMYKRPGDILFYGTFADAKGACKTADRWLLVNIQTDDDFECHTLNRDVWADDTVKEIIRCSFIFWQNYVGVPESDVYMRRYAVTKLPHIAVIDPRTGGLVLRVDGPTNKDAFMEKLMDFLGDRSSPSSSDNKQQSRTGAVVYVDDDSPPNKKDVRANEVIDVDSDVEDLVTTSVSAASHAVPVLAPETTGFTVSQILDSSTATSKDMTDAGGSIKVQIKWSIDGKPVKLLSSFQPITPLSDLLLFVARKLEAQSGASKRFDVLFAYPSRSLWATSKDSTRSISELTFADLGIESGAMTLRFFD